MEKLKTKDFRKNNYFTLYDDEDNFICYFDNFNELSKIINYNASDLVKSFNRYAIDNFINIIIDNRKYKLYTFVD